jgi:hypothetical protein
MWNDLHAQFSSPSLASTDFARAPSSFWSDLYEKFAASSEDNAPSSQADQSSPDQGRSSPRKRASSIASDIGNHVVGIPAAAQRLLSRIPEAFDGVQLRVGRWKKFPSVAAASSKGQVQHGLHFVKFKARRFAAKTQGGLVNMKSVPTRMTKRTLQSARNARVFTAQLTEKAETSLVKMKQQAVVSRSRSQILQEHLSLRKSEDIKQDITQVSERAQKSLEYVKEQARVTSTAISTQVSQKAQFASSAISSSMAQTAQKGLDLARNIGGIGGATGGA